MASREQKELTDQINGLAKKLNVDPPKTDGLSTQQLSDELDRLRKRESASRQTTAEKPATDDKSTTDSGSYRVAAGKSLVGTKRDQLNAGEEVTEADVPGGKERLDELVKAGVLEQGKGTQKGEATAAQPGPGGEPVAPAPGQTTDPNVQQTNQPGTEPGK